MNGEMFEQVLQPFVLAHAKALAASVLRRPHVL